MMNQILNKQKNAIFAVLNMVKKTLEKGIIVILQANNEDLHTKTVI